MSKEISEVQRTFDEVFDNVMALAKGHLLTGEPLIGLQNLLRQHQDAINRLKDSCGAPPMFRKG